MKHILFIVALFQVSVSSPKIIVTSPAKIRQIASSEISQIESEESQAHAVEGFMANPKAVDCFDEATYRYTGGRYENEPIRFRLRNPPTVESEKTYPLIVWFHGLGESDDDNKRQLAHIQLSLEHLAGPSQLECYILATQCPKDNKSWTKSMVDDEKGDAPLIIAQEIFEAMLEEYPIDKSRISVFGLSSGGSAVWEFARRNEGRLAAIVPVSTNPPQRFSTIAKVWAFNCTGDKQAPSAEVKPIIDTINNSGGTAWLTEVNSITHNAWATALHEYKVMRWMTLQKLGETAYPPPGVVCRNNSFATFFVSYGLPILLIILLLFVRRIIVRKSGFNSTSKNVQ